MKKRFKFLMFSLLASSPVLLSAETIPSNEERVCHSEEDITVNEDLMQEHGLLNRILLIYQEIATRLQNGTEKRNDMNLLHKAASIVRNLLENHHEIMEETYIFPVVEKDGELFEMIQVLKQQHIKGRKLTDFILDNSNNRAIQHDIKRQTLADYLESYIRMFRPHESREGTIIFPKFRTLISDEDYKKLSYIVEEHEESIIGEGGFGKLIDTVADIERELGIYNLDQFTPKDL
jgi:hemerythrin-like domain-containing protein